MSPNEIVWWRATSGVFSGRYVQVRIVSIDGDTARVAISYRAYGRPCGVRMRRVRVADLEPMLCNTENLE